MAADELMFDSISSLSASAMVNGGGENKIEFAVMDRWMFTKFSFRKNGSVRTWTMMMEETQSSKTIGSDRTFFECAVVVVVVVH